MQEEPKIEADYAAHLEAFLRDGGPAARDYLARY